MRPPPRSTAAVSCAGNNVASTFGVFLFLLASPIAATMEAFVATEYVGNDWNKLTINTTYPMPRIVSPTGVLIKIEASSINPVDWKLIESNETGLPAAFPVVLGMDAAGLVAALGSSCDGRLNIGDRVWIDLADDNLGGFGNYAIAEEAHIGVMPASLNFTEAASLPLVSMTGLAALTGGGASGLPSPPNIVGKTVMVLGGSGGCGSVGIELALAMGAAKVFTTTAPSSFPFVQSLGASKPFFDYHDGVGAWAQALGPNSVDFVYDTVGESGAADAAMSALREGGAFVTIAGALAKTPRAGREQAFIHHWMKNVTALNKIRELVDDGKLHPHVSAIYALQEVGTAFARSRTGTVVGKLAVRISSTSYKL